MKTAEEIYSDHDFSWGCGPSSYQPIIDLFGRVLLQIDDEDYSGDTRVLYENDGKFGYLIFGWGSCSGCDRLQGCENMGEIQDLISDLSGKIKWFDSLPELQKYFSEKDWELNYEWDSDETKEFIKQVIDFQPQ